MKRHDSLLLRKPAESTASIQFQGIQRSSDFDRQVFFPGRFAFYGIVLTVLLVAAGYTWHMHCVTFG